MGPEPPEVFDPFRDRDPDADDPREVLADFVRSVEQFLDFVFAHPPGPIRGTWLDELEAAWTDLRERLDDGRHTLAYQVFEAAPRPDPDGRALDAHGLRGRSLVAKIHQWRDRSRAYFQLRNTRRLRRALSTAGVITESIAECTGVGAAYKEAIKGLNHLTEIALDEGA